MAHDPTIPGDPQAHPGDPLDRDLLISRVVDGRATTLARRTGPGGARRGPNYGCRRTSCPRQIFASAAFKNQVKLFATIQGGR